MIKELPEWQQKLKEMVKNNKKFHYMMVDRDRQGIDYYIRIDSREHAQKAIETVEFLLNLFEQKDIPEWYNFESLEEDKQRFNKVFSVA